MTCRNRNRAPIASCVATGMVYLSLARPGPKDVQAAVETSSECVLCPTPLSSTALLTPPFAHQTRFQLPYPAALHNPLRPRVCTASARLCGGPHTRPGGLRHSRLRGCEGTAAALGVRAGSRVMCAVFLRPARPFSGLTRHPLRCAKALSAGLGVGRAEDGHHARQQRYVFGHACATC